MTVSTASHWRSSPSTRPTPGSNARQSVGCFASSAANGRWTSFRSDLAAPCGDPDSNATALAVMALKAVGRNGAARQGRDWLIGKQLPGGGWEYSTGWGPDANSTGLAVQALVAMGVKPATVSNKGTPFDFLKTLQLDCTTSPDDRGALDYQEQTPQVANDFATAQVGQALARTALPVDWRRARSGLPRLDCPGAKGALLTTRPGQAAAGYLGRVLKDHRGVIPNAFGPGPDFGTTANAVLSLVAARRGARQVDRAMTRLESGARSFVIDDGQTVPAAAAVLTLAFETTRGNPRDVDDMNLVKRIHRSITTRP